MLWLDTSTLDAIRGRVAANTAEWQALKAECDAWLPGQVDYPDGNAYPNVPDIGQGYQGSGYYEAVMALGLAYQAIKVSDPATAKLYAAKGVDVLLKMSATGSHAQPPLTDSGYGIRFYGSGMALGYDWLHDALTVDEAAQINGTLNTWIHAFEAGGFENATGPQDATNPPQGNYFAGYYAAKGLAALGTAGENPDAAAMWTDWSQRVHGQMVQPYYQQWMAGGGWPEGWNYGPFATLNQIYPVWAAQTAKGLDLVHDAAHPYSFPMDQGLYLIHFTWPNGHTLDDRGALYSSNEPSGATTSLFTAMAGLQTLFNAPSAAVFHRFARQVRTLQSGTPSDDLTPWQAFLFWDDAAPETPVSSLPTSYKAQGMGMVAMRSDWTPNAVWASFTAAPYINNGGSGEEYFDQGSLAITRGGTPFLVNTAGALLRNTPGTTDGDNWGNLIYDDLFGTKNRTLFNVFYVLDPAGSYGQAAYDTTIAHAQLTHFEDGGAYVRMRGEKLEELYRPGGPKTPGNGLVQAWTRDVVYLRPQRFVIYDRTTVDQAGANQWMAFHLSKTPVEVAAPSPGVHRWDVSQGGTFAGAVSTLLPTGNTTSLVNVFSSGKVYRLEVRPGAQATSQRWLTVLDASSSASGVAAASRLTAADGNVLAGAIQGVLLQDPAGNEVVLFGTGTADTQVTGTLRFTIPAIQTQTLLVDLPPSTSFAATATVAAGQLTIQIASGTGFQSTATGSLLLNISPTGTVLP